MRKLILSLLLAATASLAHAQDNALTRFFDQYMEDEQFTVVRVSPKMFQMIAKINTDDPDWEKFRDVIGNLSGLYVLHADSGVDGRALYQDAFKRLPVKEYEELLTVRDGEQNLRFMIKENNNIVNELLLLVGEPSGFTALSIVGRIDLDKISTLSKAIPVDGVQHLEKMDGNSKSKDSPRAPKDPKDPKVTRSSF
ncbi:MAG: DUF4252 domain-containing protein [Saprospiraceae bacterium]